MHEKESKREGEELFPAEEEGAEEPREREAPGGQEAGEEGEEVREVRNPPVPETPSREEVLRHRLTHRPYRSWCPHCVRGKGRSDPHLRSTQKDAQSDVPKVVADYFFVGQRRTGNRDQRLAEDAIAEGDGQTPVLVLKDVRSKSLFAHACPCKGAHEAVVAKVISDLDSLGYRKVLIRTDGEGPITDLFAEVKNDGGAKW